MIIFGMFAFIPVLFVILICIIWLLLPYLFATIFMYLLEELVLKPRRERKRLKKRGL